MSLAASPSRKAVYPATELSVPGLRPRFQWKEPGPPSVPLSSLPCPRAPMVYIVGRLRRPSRLQDGHGAAADVTGLLAALPERQALSKEGGQDPGSLRDIPPAGDRDPQRWASSQPL
jgi:hypothetical protein